MISTMTDNIIKLYETGPWNPREEDMAKEMMEEGYNPHCKQDVLEYFKEIQDKYGKISEMITLFNLPVEVTWDFFPKGDQNNE
jgi:hypothetical protein